MVALLEASIQILVLLLLFLSGKDVVGSEAAVGGGVRVSDLDVKDHRGTLVPETIDCNISSSFQIGVGGGVVLPLCRLTGMD